MSEAVETRVVAILDDMFFASKIREAAKSTGVKVHILKQNSGIIEGLENAPPALIIVDLNSKMLTPLELIRELKSSHELKNIPTIGFLSHVQEELKKEAIKAGFDIVMPRSRFSRELVQILKDYNS